jgi:hypothetical protein
MGMKTWLALEPPREFTIASWIFLKVLGAIYLIAFVSFGVQAIGLIGSNGVLPLGSYMNAAAEQLGNARFRLVPTLFWLGWSDTMIRVVWVAGAVASLAIIAGFAQRITLTAALVLYLSIVTGGQTFMTFQWDLLLLEAGFIAIFLNATKIRVWFFWWLLFRLLFLSGSIKLASGDPTWRNLTALHYHYETQPLPTPIAWYMNLLPGWFQSMSVVFVFIAELLAPFILFAPGRWRRWAAIPVIGLQALIALTGNYTFFNLLTVSFCILLFDDAAWPSRLPDWIREHAGKRFARRWPRLEAGVTAALLLFIMPLSVFQMAEMLSVDLGSGASRWLAWVAPFGVVNGYGLFANMTTQRIEIVIEGSRDGTTWNEYEFPYKPGAVRRAPPWVAPFQPRLDWQMWFAALGSYRQNPFFVNLMVRLLERSPPVLSLLAGDPFHGSPPAYVRARAYRYHLTDWATRRGTGAWWRRESAGEYFPAVSLKSFTRPPAQ